MFNALKLGKLDPRLSAAQNKKEFYEKKSEIEKSIRS